MNTPQRILVLGGTGKIGRRVASRLSDIDVPIRIGSRRGEPPFDWTDRTTWSPALSGVSSAFISFYPDLSVSGAPASVGGLAEAAVQSGVGKLVLLSGRGEEEAQRSEQALAEACDNTATDWSVVRASWFSQNFSESAFAEGVQSGLLSLPVGLVGEPFVDAEDIADVVVAALTEPGHHGEVYEVTGPRLMTFADAVQEVADATGRDLGYEAVPLAAYVSLLAEYEVPSDEISMLKYLFAEVLDGRNASLADGIQRALGRPPRDFRDYARETAATGVWDG